MEVHIDGRQIFIEFNILINLRGFQKGKHLICPHHLQILLRFEDL